VNGQSLLAVSGQILLAASIESLLSSHPKGELLDNAVIVLAK
jgi:hypothetical protein